MCPTLLWENSGDERKGKVVVVPRVCVQGGLLIADTAAEIAQSCW